MHVNFFEDFAAHRDADALEKVSLLPFPSIIYVAAGSMAEFVSCRRIVLKANPHMNVGWWPTLPRSYWVSPFSFVEELEDLRDTLWAYNGDLLEVMIDLELPLLAPRLILRNLFSVGRSKQLIEGILQLGRKPNIKISTAEYPPFGRWTSWLWKALGVSFPTSQYGHDRIPMAYDSMLGDFGRILHLDLARMVRTSLKVLARTAGSHLNVGLGTIVPGGMGSSSVLDPEGLRRNLEFLQAIGVQKATIFRLAGLTPTYVDVISKFV